MELMLYVADDIQTMSNGKCVAMGLYTDRVIQIDDAQGKGRRPSPAEPAGMSSLGLLATIMGLPGGKHEVVAFLVDPSGRKMPYEIPSQVADVPTNATGVNLLFNFAPFVIPLLGLYKFVVAVDGRELEATFEVRETPKSA